jgi:hypothetical protein
VEGFWDGWVGRTDGVRSKVVGVGGVRGEMGGGAAQLKRKSTREGEGRVMPVGQKAECAKMEKEEEESFCSPSCRYATAPRHSSVSSRGYFPPSFGTQPRPLALVRSRRQYHTVLQSSTSIIDSMTNDYIRNHQQKVIFFLKNQNSCPCSTYSAR